MDRDYMPTEDEIMETILNGKNTFRIVEKQEFGAVEAFIDVKAPAIIKGKEELVRSAAKKAAAGKKRPARFHRRTYRAS